MRRRSSVRVRFFAAALSLSVLAAVPALAENEVLSVSPAEPTELDPLTVTLSGDWPDSCTPQLVGAELVGSVLEIEAIIQFPGQTCVPATTSYEATIEVGRLPAGSYRVKASGIPNFPPPIEVASTSLEVTASADFGLESIDVAPDPPTTQDRFILSASGIWPDGCVPRLDTVDIQGRTIRLYAIAQGEACIEVLSPYFLAEGVGPLPEGDWKVEVRIADRRFGNVEEGYELAGRRSLTIGPKASDVLLIGGRFGITVTWNDGAEESGVAQPIRGALPTYGETGSGAFWFFNPENTELLVKVLDGCAVNGHYWVFISAATDLGFEVRVEDFGVDGLEKVYANEAGDTAVAVTDVEAFATCTS